MKLDSRVVRLGLCISTASVASAYAALGGLVALVFSVGYIGGFVLWLLVRARPAYSLLRAPYWLTLAIFVLFHKFEESRMKFFDAISGISGLPVPEVTEWGVLLMLAAGFLPWLLIPVLIKRGRELGYYLAWTFFASMGLTELAHFVFPLLIGGPYGYFPGMASVVILAPAAWWGLWRLARNRRH